MVTVELKDVLDSGYDEAACVRNQQVRECVQGMRTFYAGQFSCQAEWLSGRISFPDPSSYQA
jgi:hypothetical protein